MPLKKAKFKSLFNESLDNVLYNNATDYELPENLLKLLNSYEQHNGTTKIVDRIKISQKNCINILSNFFTGSKFSAINLIKDATLTGILFSTRKFNLGLITPTGYYFPYRIDAHIRSGNENDDNPLNKDTNIIIHSYFTVDSNKVKWSYSFDCTTSFTINEFPKDSYTVIDSYTSENFSDYNEEGFGGRLYFPSIISTDNEDVKFAYIKIIDCQKFLKVITDKTEKIANEVIKSKLDEESNG